jgi:hypothetical protein
MDSKNYWRNQDTHVNLNELKHVITTALQHRKTSQSKQRFLLFMPFEQLNNQIIGFKSACGKTITQMN